MPPLSLLTDGRRELLAALQGDPDISERVKTWWEFDRRLSHRLRVQRADCTNFALHPGRVVEPDQRTNAGYDLAQPIICVITTDGQDPTPCEELVMATINRVRAERDTMLGLADQGLKNFGISAEMVPWASEDGGGEIGELKQWQATVTVTNKWILFG